MSLSPDVWIWLFVALAVAALVAVVLGLVTL
jgi:hypothetical protein